MELLMWEAYHTVVDGVTCKLVQSSLTEALIGGCKQKPCLTMYRSVVTNTVLA